MRFGKAKIASQRARGAHAHIGHLRLQFRQHRLLLAHQRRSLDGAVRARRANFDCAVARFDGVHSRRHLEIDEMAVVQRAVLHGQQQFGPAGIDAGIIAVMRQHLRRFSDAGGLMNLEPRERGHARVFAAGTFAPPEGCVCAAGAGVFLFLSCSAFHTRSGVSGSLRMRTPVA